MGDVRQFPARPLTEDDKANLRAMLTPSPALTLEDLVHGDLEAIRQVGPWVARPDSATSDLALRIAAIAQGLLGPGQVRLGPAAEALGVLVYDLQDLAEQASVTEPEAGS